MSSSSTIPAEVRQMIVSAPEGRMSAAVAHLVAPMARTWLDTARANHGPASLAELTTWVASVEVLARWYRRHLSDENAAHGLLAGNDPDDTESVGGSVGTEEAAYRLGITARSVCRLLDRGELHGTKVSGRVWLIDSQSIENHKRRAA